MNERIAIGVLTGRESGAPSSGTKDTNSAGQKPGGDVLVCCRASHQKWAGYWEFPGGKVRANETVFQGLKRELTEEIGIHCLEAESLVRHTYRGAHQDPNENPNPDHRQKTLLLEFWHVTRWTGEPVGMEGQEVRWQPADELASLKFLPGNRHIIPFLRQYLQRPRTGKTPEPNSAGS